MDMHKILGAAVVSLAVFMPIPAFATGGVYCTGVGNASVEANLGLGRVPTLAVISADITTPNGNFSMNPKNDATPVIVGQGYQDADVLRVDFTDTNVEKIVLSLRLVRASRGRTIAEAGVLIVGDEAVYPVVCESE